MGGGRRCLLENKVKSPLTGLLNPVNDRHVIVTFTRVVFGQIIKYVCGARK
jgi:hypothetical protein